MAEDEFRLLVDSLGGSLFQDNPESSAILNCLMRETLKFRDKLKEDTGQILTVNDTRLALDALETHLNGQKMPRGLSSEQKALAQIFIDSIFLFKLKL